MYITYLTVPLIGAAICVVAVACRCARRLVCPSAQWRFSSELPEPLLFVISSVSVNAPFLITRFQHQL